MLPTGPMRVEPWTLTETRFKCIGELHEHPPEPSITLRTKLTGEKLRYLSGRGEMIIEEMVDDTGLVLMTIDDFAPRELTKIYPLRAGKKMMTVGYAGLTVKAKSPSRQARKLSKVRGYVNTVYAETTEEIMIDNPLQFSGGLIKHPRLEELGIKIKVIDPDPGVVDKREKGGIALQFPEGSIKKVRKIEFFDGWLKPLYARERPVTKPDQDEYIYYAVMIGPIDGDSQMLLKFYPEVEEQRVEFEMKDIELP